MSSNYLPLTCFNVSWLTPGEVEINNYHHCLERLSELRKIGMTRLDTYKATFWSQFLVVLEIQYQCFNALM